MRQLRTSKPIMGGGIMRSQPDLWPGADRIQWGCVLMQMLGEQSLEHLHVTLAGLRSIARSRQAAPFEKEIDTARILLGDLLTKNAVQNATYDFVSDGRFCSFEIDAKQLTFRPVYTAGRDADVAVAEQILREGLERQPTKWGVADSKKDLIVQLEGDRQIPIRLNGLRFPTIRQHDLTRRLRQPIEVQWSELVTLARELDAEDRQAQRPLQDWTTRVERIRLQAANVQGLEDCDSLDLTGIKHLIGLPGAGKTTLISLLCVLLSRRRQRIAVFFTSIAVAREYLEQLRRYDVKVGILVGRSGTTHRRHANQMAEFVAGRGDGGFAHKVDGIELFATSCPLPAFAESWPQDWPLGEAPCESIYEAGSEQRKLCPAWERCGRVKNQRDLVTADVWLGHVLSADTQVPGHTSSERLNYFELIAETFDLAIFDECDETQHVLDELGALKLELTGDDQSMHVRLQKLTGLLAANKAHVSDGLLRYSLQANEFERHTLRLVTEIRRLSKQKGTQNLADYYADKLLTAAFLMRELLEAAGSYEEFKNALSAVSDFWESAMYRAFFFRGEYDNKWSKASKYAADLYLSPDAADEHWCKVNQSLRRFLALDHAAAADEIVDEIAEVLALVFHAAAKDRIRDHVRLLIAVGFTVASYQRLARAARPLAQRGEIGADLVSAKPSPDLRHVVPRSIAGTFSAVRYSRSSDNKGYAIDYLVMDSTPRLLMYRMHELGRVNVLLTSATSWLELSPKYHVNERPAYVLSPNAAEFGTVRLYALPKQHPSTRKALRFSGAGTEREENLRHMVTALTQAGVDDLSEIERAVQAMDTELGRKRKAALVVNSYEQVQIVVERINDMNAGLGDRTRGVLKSLPTDRSRKRYVLRGQAEELGQDDDVDVVVFPIAALGRGVNIVFRTDDEDNGKAAVGSVYFLTRPHPAVGDLGLMTSILAQATQAMDGKDFQFDALADVHRVYNVERHRAYGRVANLLARPVSASRLDAQTLTNFAADLLVPILQTVGRAMRKRMPVSVYFVDAAWAPNSAEGIPESERSSVLVVMGRILEECMAHPDPGTRAVYGALYGVFRDAFSDIIKLIPPDAPFTNAESVFVPSTTTSAMEFDDYDPGELNTKLGNDDDSTYADEEVS